MLRTAGVFALPIIAFFLAKPLGFEHLIHPQKWIMLAFFGAMSYLTYTLTTIGLRNNQEKFIELYFVSFSIRLVLMLVFIGTMLLVGSEKPYLFVINFFVLYLLFTVFEIINILRKLRRFSKEGSEGSLSNNE